MKPPTIEEIMEYAGKDFDAEAFFLHYDRIGWRVAVGKTTTPMTNWHSAIAYWKKRAKEQVNKPQNKPRLFAISGKKCGKCPLPAVYKATGEFDHYYCLKHSPKEVQEKYSE